MPDRRRRQRVRFARFCVFKPVKPFAYALDIIGAALRDKGKIPVHFKQAEGAELMSCHIGIYYNCRAFASLGSYYCNPFAN